jgi:peptide/nickel transport system substrate-binding protein
VNGAQKFVHLDVLGTQHSRREFLKKSLLLTASVTATGTLLVACGEDDGEDVAAGDEISDDEDVTVESDDEDDTDDDTPDAAPETGGEIGVGLNLEPDNLDSAVTPWAVSHTVMMNIYDTLVWRDLEGDFVEGLATEWDVSDDGTVFTFQLRDDVTFHDGTEFNAEAVQKFLDRVILPETESGFAASLIGPYDHSEILDEHALEVHFEEPFAPFLDGMSQAFLGITSPTAQEDDPGHFLRNPVGTGFMKFVEWVDGDRIVLERNEDYQWGPPIFDNSGPAHLDRITIRFYSDNPTRTAALEAGDVQVIEVLPNSDLQRIEDDPDFDVSYAVSPGLPEVMVMNTNVAPTDELAVRQAIATAIDRQAVVDTGYFGATTPAYGPLWEDTPYYSDAVEDHYQYDTEAAREILEEAGWEEGDDGIYERDGQRLVVEWAATDSTAPYDELVQSHLRAAGIECELVRMTSGAAGEAMTNDEVNIRSLGWISSDPVVLSNILHSRNHDAWAQTKFQDDRLDELLDRGERTIDSDERQEIYEEIQLIVMDNALYAPLVGIPRNLGINANLGGVGQDIRTYPWFLDAYLED